MPIHNADAAEVFSEIADLLEIQGANPFRVRASRNAARSVGEHAQNVRTMVAQSADLKAIAAIGDDLALKIREIVATGTCSLLSAAGSNYFIGPRILDIFRCNAQGHPQNTRPSRNSDRGQPLW